MNTPFFKKALPHVIAVVIFLIVAAVYCMPALEGKVLQQHDNVQWKGMSKDAFNYHEKHGFFPLWTNNLFSGMPSFQVASNFNNLLPYYVTDILTLKLPKPVNFFFLASICFYFLLSVLRVNNIIRILGALAFAYATYNPVILSAGHDTKMQSIAYMPAFLASLILICEGRYWIGTALTGLFTCQLIASNHQQIAYYAFIVAAGVSISYAIVWIRTKDFKRLFSAAGLAITGIVVGVMVNASVLLTIYDYAKETIRSGSVLAKTKDNKKTEGLSIDYAFDYSMYKSEPLVMMFPKIYGGSSDKEEKPQDESKALEALGSMPRELQSQFQYSYQFYWGGIKSTSGPAYSGAVICFLAIIGMFILDRKHKWWIAAVVGLTIVMSWGSYFLGFNEWLLEHLPFYNKFRAPSMILVVPQLLLPLLACISLDKILQYHSLADKEVFMKKFYKGLVAVGAVILMPVILYFGADFLSLRDYEVMKQVREITEAQVKEPIMAFFSALKEDRQSLLLSTIWRSLFLCIIAAGLIYMYFKNTLKPIVVTILFTVVCFIDLMMIDVKYLNKENYLEKEEYEGNFAPSAADQAILQDKTFFRVFNTTRDPFNDALTSYYHHSVAGYHPAKLSIYQDLIDHQLSKQPANMPVFNMLNTKYFIGGGANGNPEAQQNPGALGNAWFVKQVNFVNGPAEEMKALDHFNPKDTAIVDKIYQSAVNYQPGAADSASSITLVNNDNDYIEYSTTNNANGFGVFSEVFYDKGWKAFIDNKETAIAKVNYVLRGLSIPAGKHKIEFKFEPAVYKTGSMLTAIAQILLLLMLAGAIFFSVRKRKVTV